MGAQPLKDNEKAETHLYVKLSAPWLISGRAGLWPQSLPWSQGPRNPSARG